MDFAFPRGLVLLNTSPCPLWPPTMALRRVSPLSASIRTPL
jgi:hypothetical protein